MVSRREISTSEFRILNVNETDKAEGVWEKTFQAEGGAWVRLWRYRTEHHSSHSYQSKGFSLLTPLLPHNIPNILLSSSPRWSLRSTSGRVHSCAHPLLTSLQSPVQFLFYINHLTTLTEHLFLKMSPFPQSSPTETTSFTTSQGEGSEGSWLTPFGCHLQTIILSPKYITSLLKPK